MKYHINHEHISNIKTFVRVRPLLSFQDEPAWNISDNQIQCLHTKNVINNIDKDGRRSKYDIQNCFKQLTINFQSIIDQKLSSQKFYKQQIRKQIKQCLQNSSNLTLMCYGQTCSGKTYTILGQQKIPGLMPCLLRQLIMFCSSKQNKLTYSIQLSYFQIYNQSLYDLLEVHKNKQKPNHQFKKLKLYEDKIYGWQVEGLKRQKVSNFQQCVKIIQKGQKNRSYRSKQNHQRSSRSHTLMKVYIESCDSNYNKHQQHINIIDLAGSQRLTANSPNINQMQTASINKSLFQLSNVISKLSARQQHSHIPFRDSKLTKLLQKSLNSSQNKCLMIFCISPSINCFNESISTLRLAQKAKQIYVKMQLPEPAIQEKELLKTKRKLRQKQEQCQLLNKKLDQLMGEVKSLQNKIKNDRNFTANANLIVLLDHQNFQIQNICKSIQNVNEEQLNSNLKEVKQKFMRDIQLLYEQYSTNIIHQYIRAIRASQSLKIHQEQDILIKLEEICFLNMIFQSPYIIRHKIQVIQNILKDFTQSIQQKGQGNNQQMVYIIKKYLTNLKQKQQPFKVQKQNLSPLFISKLKENQDSPQQYKNQIQIQDLTQNNQAKSLYMWGCSKDNRVCKGKNLLNGIVQASLPQNITISRIMCGFNHSLLTTSTGDIYGWGKNNQHQVNYKDQLSVSIPKRILLNEKITSIAAGWAHSLCLTQNGEVFSWGYGQNGQLGHGCNQNQQKPKKLNIKKIIKQIFAGHSNSAIITDQNIVYFFGFNHDYRCLNSESSILNEPVKIPIVNVKCASLGTSHSSILTYEGQLFCGGIGSNGELGVDLSLDIIGTEYIQVQSKAHQQSGKFEKIHPLIQVQYLKYVGNNQQIVDVKCGESCTYVLTTCGNLYQFGKLINQKQQRTTQFRIILKGVAKFSVGSRHGFAIMKNKNVFGWGFNMYNQLANGKQKDTIIPELIGSLNSLKISSIECGFMHSIGLAS